MYLPKGKTPQTEDEKMQVTYYAERIGGEIKYFKVNTDRFGQRVAKIEIEKWEYDWATSKKA
jgi:hypothetical protein|nr:MAG TPA: hypothetical protein [Caudoviricetes sp.]